MSTAIFPGIDEIFHGIDEIFRGIVVISHTTAMISIMVDVTFLMIDEIFRVIDKDLHEIPRISVTAEIFHITRTETHAGVMATTRTIAIPQSFAKVTARGTITPTRGQGLTGNVIY